MSIEHITDHIAQAKDRLLEQYKGKPKMEALVEAFIKPLQDIEDAGYDLIFKRSLDEAEGVQLDRLGDIVGIRRNGLSDSQYRLRIRARIFVNVSAGQFETLVLIYKLLSDATFVIGQEWYPAGVGLMSNGIISDPEDQNFVLELLELAAAGGVRIEAIGKFDAENPYAFEGLSTPVGDGFGDSTDLAVGGKFADLYDAGPEFAFAGDDPKPEGFGSCFDPLVGGRMIGL